MGRPGTSLAGAVFIWAAFNPNPGRARREAVELVSRIYAQDFDPLADRYLLHGDPDMVAARLAEYHAAVAGTVIFWAACPPERPPAVTELFAGAVLPGLRRHISHRVARNRSVRSSRLSRRT